MYTVIITASVSVVVAVLVFLLNRSSQKDFNRREALLSRVNAQLRDLYGPLHALVRSNEIVWKSLKDNSIIPSHGERVNISRLGEDDLKAWAAWLNHSLMPYNLKMRDLILGHADLIIETDMPDQLIVFCAHASSYEVMLQSNGKFDQTFGDSIIRHPGSAYIDYVNRSFAALKEEQANLLEIKSIRRRRLTLHVTGRLTSWVRARLRMGSSAVDS
jgi:hypothetical protein